MKHLTAVLFLAVASAAWAEVRVSSPDGKVTAVAKDKIITVLDNGTQKTILSVRAHSADITGMSYSPDGKTLASLDKDGVLNMLDAPTGKVIRTFRTGMGGELSYSQDGKTLTIKADKKTKKFDVATGKEIQ